MKRPKLAVSDFPALQLCAALKIVRESHLVKVHQALLVCTVFTQVAMHTAKVNCIAHGC